MKKLQNNYTTPEQSKRLLELGVPADSADMMYYPEFTEDLYSIGNGGFRMSDTPRVLRAYEKFSNSTRYDSDKFRELCAPCWSAGRLIEIWLHCNKFSIDSDSEPITIGLIDFSVNFIDDFIHLIKKAVGSKHIDFSKLEN